MSKKVDAVGEWTNCTLAEACSAINYGLTASASNRSDGPKFLRITDIVSGPPNWNTVPHVEADDDTIAKYRLCDGDIVIARTGASTGTSAYIRNPPPSVFASYLVRLQARPEFDSRFLAYYLKSREFSEFMRGVLGDKSAQPNASASTMTSAPFKAPKDKAEQRAIAHVLGTLDDKIELNRRMNETLEGMARALFKSWFVDFDPVLAKMNGRWRRGQSLPGLPADLYDLFPDRLVTSELGEIPEGWEVKGLNQIVKLNPSESMKKGKVAPYLNMAALPTSGPNPDDAVLREFTSGTRFRNGDTLFARITPCLENGKTAFVQSLPDDTLGWGSTEFIVMRSIPPVPPEYTYLLARDPRFRAHAIQSMTGTSGRQRARTESLVTYPLPFPPADTWAAFDLIVQPLFAKIRTANERTHTLAAQRDTLLPKLVSANLRFLSSSKEYINGRPPMTKNLYLFVDTNLFIQCRGLYELDWSEWEDFSEVHLIVCLPVQREIDKQKIRGNNRVGRRARDTYSSLFRAIATGEKEYELIKEVQPQVKLFLESPSRPDPELASSLDYGRPDDEIIGCLHRFAKDHPDFDVRLLTHDTGPMMTARGLGLSVAPIRNEWVLPPENNDEEREIARLRQEAVQLKKAEPQFDIKCVDGEGADIDVLEVVHRIYGPLSEDDISHCMNLLEQMRPIETEFNRRDPMPIALSVTRVFGQQWYFEPASEEAIRNYRDHQYPEWIDDCREWLINVHETLQREEGFPFFRFEVTNVGARPGKDALVVIRAKGGFKICPPQFEEDQPEETEKTELHVPTPPRSLAEKW